MFDSNNGVFVEVPEFMRVDPRAVAAADVAMLMECYSGGEIDSLMLVMAIMSIEQRAMRVNPLVTVQ